ncbi:hypothetical protein HAX54_051835, partial [Datura stramonium]|nr:hypothetical protein [Datura stramonium]
SGLSRSNRSQSLFPGFERLVRKDQERSVVRSSSRSEGAKESNDIISYPYPRKGNVISFLERIRSLCCEQEEALQMKQAMGEKERLVLRNPADIELKLAAAIEREESSVTSGLSSFPVQMNKPVFSLSETEVQLQALNKRRKTWLQGKFFRKERSQAYAELRVDLPWPSKALLKRDLLEMLVLSHLVLFLLLSLRLLLHLMKFRLLSQSQVSLNGSRPT